MFPLSYVRQFNPFRIDALGIVTLLGAEEVNKRIGTLVRNRYLEHLPLLGAYVIASDAFTDKQPGFQLYNFSAGIFTPDIAGWFTRWLMAQDLRTACSCVDWNVDSKPRSFTLHKLLAFTLGFLVSAGFMSVTVLMGDWWGFANAVSMTVSTLARAFLVGSNRDWLDAAVRKTISKEFKDKMKYPNGPNYEKLNHLREKVKILVVLSDARAVVIRIPTCLVLECFVFNPKPSETGDGNKRTKTWPLNEVKGDRKPQESEAQLSFYKWVRWTAWLGFGAHVITIGMSDLVSQLITVAIVVGPTFLMLQGFGWDEMRVGSLLCAEISDFPSEVDGPERRIDLYAFLNLTITQKASLDKWNLAAILNNKEWWEDYDRKNKLYNTPTPLLDMSKWQDRNDAMVVRKGSVQPATNTSAAPASVGGARHTQHHTA